MAVIFPPNGTKAILTMTKIRTVWRLSGKILRCLSNRDAHAPFRGKLRSVGRVRGPRGVFVLFLKLEVFRTSGKWRALIAADCYFQHPLVSVYGHVITAFVVQPLPRGIYSIPKHADT